MLLCSQKKREEGATLIDKNNPDIIEAYSSETERIRIVRQNGGEVQYIPVTQLDLNNQQHKAYTQAIELVREEQYAEACKVLQQAFKHVEMK